LTWLCSGTEPTGNCVAGSSDVTQLTALSKRVLSAIPIQSGYAKPKAVASERASARVEAVAKARPAPVGEARSAVKQRNQGVVDLVDRAIASLAGIKHHRH